MAEHLHKLKFVFSYVKGLTSSQMQVVVHQFYQTKLVFYVLLNFAIINIQLLMENEDTNNLMCSWCVNINLFISENLSRLFISRLFHYSFHLLNS